MRQRSLYQLLTFYSLYSSDNITALLSHWRLGKTPKQSSLCNVDFLRVTHSLISSWWSGSGLFFWPRKLSFNLDKWPYKSFRVRNSWEGLWILYHRPGMGAELLPFPLRVSACGPLLRADDGWCTGRRKHTGWVNWNQKMPTLSPTPLCCWNRNIW